MTRRYLASVLTMGVLTLAMVLAMPAWARMQGRSDDRREKVSDDRREQGGSADRDDDDRGRGQGQVAVLPTGQYVTPTVIPQSHQQSLNPRLPAYPDFVAGEAVRSQLSPNGTTLAIITAGQNSLYKPDGTVDVANSTQFIFLYDVAGAHQASLRSSSHRTNERHVGLAFSPDGKTLYAAGGNDDAVYVYTKSGDTFTPAAPIPLGHFAPGATGSARNKGIGLGVQPNASGLGVSSDGKTLVVANNYNDSISVIDTASRAVRYEHDLRPYFANNEGTGGGVGGTFPFGVVVKDNGIAYVYRTGTVKSWRSTSPRRPPAI